MFTLCKEERLCRDRAISNLFDCGHSSFRSPYKFFWVKVSEAGACSFPARFAVSVPKRRFKRAVKRNLLKRRTREAFRKHKQILNTAVAGDEQIHLMVIYASDKLLSYVEIEDSMEKILQHIARQYVESV